MPLLLLGLNPPPRPLNSFLLSTWDLGVVGPFLLPPRPLNSFLLLLGWLRLAVRQLRFLVG